MATRTDNRIHILSGKQYKNFTLASGSSGNITITAAQLIAGGIFSQDPEGSVNWTLDTGANINSALSDIGITAASGDTLVIILHNAATASSGEVVTIVGNTNVTLNGLATLTEGTNSTMKLVLRYDGTDWQAYLGNRSTSTATILDFPSTQTQILEGDEAALNEKLGYDLAQDGAYLIAGAIDSTPPTIGSGTPGSAYIFKYNGTSWAKLVRLDYSDTNFANVGCSVAIMGSYAVIGGYSSDDGVLTADGRVHIFEKDTGGSDNWGNVANVSGSRAANHENLGFSVGVYADDDDLFAFGCAPSDHNTNADTGTLYIYDGNDSWNEIQALGNPQNGANSDMGGTIRAISTTKVGGQVVVAVSASVSGTAAEQNVFLWGQNQGGADNWGLIKTVTASDISSGDNFGNSVSLVEEYLVVGAPDAPTTAESATGAVYIFEKDSGGTDNWGQTKKIEGPDNVLNFGGDAKLAKNKLDVSISNAAENVSTVANVNVYHHRRNEGGANNWGLVETFTIAASPVIQWGFKTLIDSTNEYMFISAIEYPDTSGDDYGAVYAFKHGT